MVLAPLDVLSESIVSDVGATADLERPQTPGVLFLVEDALRHVTELLAGLFDRVDKPLDDRRRELSHHGDDALRGKLGGDIQPEN